MFESIVVKNSIDHKRVFDIGALAESLLFYQHVHVVANTVTTKILLEKIPPHLLLSLVKEGRLSIHYLTDHVGVSSQSTNMGDVHNLLTFSSPDHTIEKTLRAQFISAGGGSSQAKIGASRFVRLVKPIGHGLFSQDQILNTLIQKQETELAIAEILKVIIPSYKQPSPIRFELIQGLNGFSIQTNIDFAAANHEYHKQVSKEHSSLTPSYLVALLQGIYEDLYFAGMLGAEMQVNAVSSCVHELSVRSALARRLSSQSNIATFSDLTLDGSAAIRESINSGALPFHEFVPVIRKADRFREWLKDRPADAELLREYYAATVEKRFAEKLPAKTTRWSLFTGIGLGLDALGAAGLGTALGVGVSALDAFVVEKLASGWRPHQFVEDELKPKLSGSNSKSEDA